MTELETTRSRALRLYPQNLSTVKTAVILKVSPQRVHQILRDEERRTGRKIIVPRRGRPGTGKNSICPSCGGKKTRSSKINVCAKCYHATMTYFNRIHVDDETLETIIIRKLAGESWYKLFQEYNYSSFNAIAMTVIRFLCRNNDPRLAQIYPNGLPQWYINQINRKRKFNWGKPVKHNQTERT